MKPRPTFQQGEELSAGKLNELSGQLDAARLDFGPGLHGEQSPEGVVARDARYRRITIGKTGGAGYPASATDILTEYPFQFVDIDPELGIGTAVLERDGEFNVRNMLGNHIPEDTLVELVEHRGEWWTSYGSDGGSKIIFFKIEELLCDPITGEKSLLVTPDRIAPPCASVDEISSGTVEVFDNGFVCILDEYTEEDLLGPDLDDGIRGAATYTSTIDQYCQTTKTWTLLGLCNIYGCVDP